MRVECVETLLEINNDAVPGAVVATQTFGDFLDFHPHLHIICTDGCFSSDGTFMVSPRPCAEDLEDAFRKEVFGMLKKEGKITDVVIENMMGWHHSGFNIYCGPAIWPHNEAGVGKFGPINHPSILSPGKNGIYSERTFR